MQRGNNRLPMLSIQNNKHENSAASKLKLKNDQNSKYYFNA